MQRLLSQIHQRVLLSVLAALVLNPLLLGQEAPTPTEENQASLTVLSDLLERRNKLDEDIAKKRSGIEKATTQEQSDEIEDEIKTLKAQREDLSRRFDLTATGVRPSDLKMEDEAARTVQEEILQLAKPMFDAWREATASPREIQGLRDEIEDLQTRLDFAKIGQKKFADLVDVAGGGLKETLQERLEFWNNIVEVTESQIAASELQLSQLESKEVGFVGGVSNMFKNFFRSRGWNLLLSLLVFIAVFVALRRFYPIVLKMSPVHQKQRSFATRLVEVLYTLSNVFVALIAALITLFIAGDWLLLSVAALLMLGFFWGVRNALPPFMEEIRLILNVGPVREDERIIYNGIPWKVSRLALYCQLVNPELNGGLLRLPAKALLNCTSREYGHDEAWFPTQKGDWVLLSDETYGKVVIQTPEYVQLLEKGGARRSYLTPDFLALAPLNMSHNFRMNSVFGIDYSHQAISTTQVPEIFRDRLIKGLKEAYDKELFVSLNVYFRSAGASSLDYEILADYKGEAAPLRPKILRKIQEICVDVCNEQGWSIPFQQITIHQAD